MKKNIARAVLAGLGSLLIGYLTAATYPYVGYLANEAGLAYNRTYTLNVNSFGINSMSAQAVYSSATFNSGTFKDGTTSTGSVNVASYSALVAAAGTNTITVSANSLLGGVAGTNQVYVTAYATPTTGGLSGSNVTLAGTWLSNGVDWLSGYTASNTATNIAAAVNAKDFRFTATATGSTVTITCAQVGTQCNSYALSTTTPTALGVSSSVFLGGAEPANFKINAQLYTAGKSWFVKDVASNTAVDIARDVNARSPIVSASTTASTVVTLTCKTTGSACNFYTLVSSTNGSLGAGGAVFSGGTDNAVFGINGTMFPQGINWTAAKTASDTARSLSDALMANSAVSAVIKSTWTSAGILYATSTLAGSGVNFALYSSSPGALTPSGATMTGGTAPAFALSGSNISVSAHGWTLALPVLYSSGSNVAIGGLTNQTTYYVVPVDANTIKLSSTSAVAQSGVGIVITSTNTQNTADTYTLAPLAIAGQPNFKWQFSNDGISWLDVAVSSVTMSSYVNPSTSTAWDFGTFDYQYLRLNVTGPTAGGILLQVYVNSKN